MRITIMAEDNKWLTDGENYGKTISLAKDADIKTYYEITEAEYQEIMAKSEETV